MADIGAITEIVNASELTLEVGSDTYIMLTNLVIHVGNTEDRIATTDADVLYAYGKSESFFTATLVVTTPELSSLNTLTNVSANGDLTSTDWLIVGTDVSGNAKTFEATGVLKEYDVRKNEAGLVEIDIFVRITDNQVTITGP